MRSVKKKFNLQRKISMKKDQKWRVKFKIWKKRSHIWIKELNQYFRRKLVLMRSVIQPKSNQNTLKISTNNQKNKIK